MHPTNGGAVRRKVAILAVVASTLLVTGLSAGQVSAAGDDDIPGVPMPAPPVQGYLDSKSDANDVYSLAMNQGDRLAVTLNGDSTSDGNFYIDLFGPGSMGIGGTDPVAVDHNGNYPKTMTYSATTSGTYYVALWCYKSDSVYGNYSMDWACRSPNIASVKSRSKAVRKGASVAIVGNLRYDLDSAPIAAKKVTLQRSVSGSGWRQITSKKTDASGHFSFKVRVTKTTSYRVHSAQTNTLLKCTSNTVKYKVR